VRAGIDVAGFSRYQWRGLSRDNGWVVQPDAYAAVRTPFGWLTVGAWGTIDLARPAPSDLAVGRRWFGESNIWAELSASAHGVHGAVGWTGYWFDGTALGLTPPEATNEVYLRLDAPGWGRIVPQVTAWYDVDRVDGAYVEGSVTVRIPLWNQILIPVGSLNATTLVGASLGQEVNAGDPAEAAYFVGRGITHWDVSLWTRTRPVPFWIFEGSLGVEFHLQINVDPATELADGAGRREDSVTWLGVSFSVSGPRCRPDRTVCR